MLTLIELCGRSSNGTSLLYLLALPLVLTIATLLYVIAKLVKKGFKMTKRRFTRIALPLYASDADDNRLSRVSKVIIYLAVGCGLLIIATLTLLLIF